jgi:hypothetical protein
MIIVALVGVMLFIQIIPAYAGDSEARKKAKEREEQIAKGEKAEKIKNLENQKKALDPKTITVTTKEPKGKAATESSNAARKKALDDAKKAIDTAKTKLDNAKKALKLNLGNATKVKDVEEAQKALEKAKIDKELLKLK